MQDEIFIALGSNVGDREGNLLRAVAEIGRLPGSRITALSPFYDTEPVGDIPQDNFLNAVIRITSPLSPHELLAALLEVETGVFGRIRDKRWEPRSMDLDLIFYGQEVISDPPTLLLPHPLAAGRRFVLAPLADIAPDFVHPILDKTVKELLEDLPPGGSVTKV